MITGYNTDIEFDGVVYHIQTEDKGASTPVIMSLVYDRGTILASKRVSYDDLINGTLDENLLSERLQRQHKLICAAVSAGRIEDLKQMSARNLKTAAAKRGVKKKSKASPEPEILEMAAEQPTAAPEVAPVWPTLDEPPSDSAEIIPDTIPFFSLNEVLDPPTGQLAPIAKPAFEPLPPIKLSEPIIGEPVIEEIDIVTDEPIMVSLDAVQSISDLAGTDRPESTKLSIDILGETRFRGGERKEVCVMVCRGSSRKVVPRAEVMVKVLGSDFRPVVTHTITDNNGVAMVDLKIPPFQSGRATVVARAISDGEEVEIRTAIAHG